MLITATIPAALGITVRAIDGEAGTSVTITLASTRAAVTCPVCDTPARRVHSRYARTLADLPWQGLAVQLRLETRRFVCETASCIRRIFAEPFPGLAPARSRRTARLTALYRAVGLALGGEPGARLVADLGMTISPDTLLRLLRALAIPSDQTVRVLGGTIGPCGGARPMAPSSSIWSATSCSICCRTVKPPH